ncbi:TonB-dependent receptor [Roseomonas sp. NAR14]|uniref:TonB-dependent receptor n=1 Tax=Roseomonas acroporae TaxID=2937791 RepID=A0A9X1YCE0_9PROT|nr:TonB-dependent receptor [Roseomonas acroporae]MCK8783916.1 TonB-dependent receptor [Roseomonas acroporae]
MPHSFRPARLALAGLGLLAGRIALAQPAAGEAAPAAVELPETSVTASPIATEDARSFAPVTVLRREDLATRPAQSLGDTLWTEPGLSATTFAPGASRPIIRGLGDFRVRLQENGFAAGDVSAFGDDHVVPLDPLSADRIEVVRGPAALRWGSQAIGGVVNLINNRIPLELLEPGAVRGRVSGAYNTGSRGFDGSASTDMRVGNFMVHGDLFGRTAGDYDIPGGGRQRNSSLDTDGQSFGLSYFFDQGFIGTSFERFRTFYEIPGGEQALSRTALDVEQLRWASRGEYRPLSGPFSSLSFRLGYTQYQHNEVGLEAGDDGSFAAGGRVVHGGFRNRLWDSRLEAQHVPVDTGIGTLTGAIGVSFEYERLRTTQEAYDFLPPNDTARLAAYVFEELALTDVLRLQAAARIESVSVNGATALFPAGYLATGDAQALTNFSAARAFAPKSVSLGLVRDLPWGMRARLTGQYVERAPGAAELFSRGGHDASGTFDIGNPNLRVESARTVELGLSRPAGALRFDGSVYFSQYGGFIYRALTGNSCDDTFASCGPGGGREFIQTNYSQRDARFYGGELSGQLDLLPIGDGMFGVSARYDLVRAEFDGGGNVPRIPPQRLGGGLWYRSPSWQASVDYLHAFEQTRTSENETRTPGYNLLNARIGYTARLEGRTPREIGLFVAGTNLLDVDMRNSASFKKDQVLLPGRTVRLLATMTF